MRVRVKESSPQAYVQIQAEQEKKKSVILQSAATSVDRSHDAEMQLAGAQYRLDPIIQIHKLTTPPIQSNIQLVTDENTYVTVMVGLITLNKKWNHSYLIRPGSLPKDSGHCGNQSIIIIINTTVRIQSVSWSHV